MLPTSTTNNCTFSRETNIPSIKNYKKITKFDRKTRVTMEIILIQKLKCEELGFVLQNEMERDAQGYTKLWKCRTRIYHREGLY